MPRRRSGGSRQPDLFPRSKRAAIALPDNHPMVVLTEAVDWTEMEVRAEKIREKKLKNAAGRPPHLRATLGALTLMALRRLPYREVEEQIRYYAPARYLCGLTETDWTPDFTTIQDFAQLISTTTLACGKNAFNRFRAMNVKTPTRTAALSFWELIPKL